MPSCQKRAQLILRLSNWGRLGRAGRQGRRPPATVLLLLLPPSPPFIHCCQKKMIRLRTQKNGVEKWQNPIFFRETQFQT
jgi:hypothetical protein